MQSHSITYRIATGPKKGQKVFQLQLLPPTDNGLGSLSSDPVASYAGFNLHAGLKVGSKQRDKLERLCRYLCRPPLAHARLTLTEDEKVVYRLKTPFRSGVTHVIFEPEDFISKLSALIPPPRANLTRYFGVFAPASRLRQHVTPTTISEASDTKKKKTSNKLKRYIPWANLLKRVFKHDVENCVYCGGAVKVDAVVNDRKTIDAILSELESTGQIERSEPTFEQVAQLLRGPPDLNI